VLSALACVLIALRFLGKMAHVEEEGSAMSLRRTILVAPLCLILVTPSRASSETPSDRLGAEALAEEGAKLMSLGDYERGCKKFEESATLDPSPARLIALASCQERRGKVASAWAALGEAAELADARGEPKRLAQARETQKRLEPSIGRLKIVVPDEAQAEDLVVTRDGSPLPYTLWGLPVAVDPGPHVVRVTAPGRLPWQAEVGMMPGPGTAVLRIPVLQVDAEAPKGDREKLMLDRRGPMTQESPIPVAARTAPVDEAPADSSAGRTQRTVGLVLAGTGVASLLVGTAFALSARSTHNDLGDSCSGNVCSASAVTLLDQERVESARADIALGIGVAALAGGAVVYFSAPTSSSPQTGGGPRVAGAPAAGPVQFGASVVPGAAAVVASGRF
jgi:hypothetical protein